jgi:hypothetical protein
MSLPGAFADGARRDGGFGRAQREGEGQERRDSQARDQIEQLGAGETDREQRQNADARQYAHDKEKKLARLGAQPAGLGGGQPALAVFAQILIREVKGALQRRCQYVFGFSFHGGDSNRAGSLSKIQVSSPPRIGAAIQADEG